MDLLKSSEQRHKFKNSGLAKKLQRKFSSGVSHFKLLFKY